VAQRRRRVFVVGYLGDWRRAAAVLFERESLSGHPAPSREAREEVAQCLTTRTGSAYDPTTETLPIAFSSNMSVPDCQTDGSTPTLKLGGHGGGNPPAVAFQQNTRDEVRYIGGDGKIAGALAASAGMKQTNYIQKSLSVRRLTPTECERLQGFPDDYTLIPYRNRMAADGPRYKAMGNSMAVPVMRWIGQRINEVDKIK